MSTVDSVEIESISNSLKNVVANLQNDYNSINNTINKINNCIETLENWNGNYASNEILYQLESFSGPLGLPLKKRIYYRDIWDIKVSKNNYSLSSISTILDKFQENINLLDLKSDDLNLLSSTLYSYISTLGSLLQVDYEGDISKFFNDIKDNPGWQFEKLNAQETIELKETDELYLKFRSQSGNDDFVDFLLDELGNRRFPQGIDGVVDDGNQNNRGASQYAQWYIDYYTRFPNENSRVNAMDNDAAYCATAVTYALVNSGNEGVIPPFISVSNGADTVIQMANEGIGVWHPASDASYQPQRGDLFYKVGGGNGNHVGIVLASDENYIYTIEGNTSSNIESFGTVNTRVRPLAYVNTGNSSAGYYTPDVYINHSVTDVDISEQTILDKTNPQVMNDYNN